MAIRYSGGKPVSNSGVSASSSTSTSSGGSGSSSKSYQTADGQTVTVSQTSSGSVSQSTARPVSSGGYGTSTTDPRILQSREPTMSIAGGGVGYVDSSGNVVKVDTATGQQTIVGSTRSSGSGGSSTPSFTPARPGAMSAISSPSSSSTPTAKPLYTPSAVAGLAGTPNMSTERGPVYVPPPNVITPSPKVNNILRDFEKAQAASSTEVQTAQQIQLAKEAGTYGKVSVPTSELVRALNLASSAKSQQLRVGTGQLDENGNEITRPTTKEEKVAYYLSSYFEKGKGNYGTDKQVLDYYDSVGVQAPKIETVSGRSMEQQVERGVFYTPEARPDVIESQDLLKPNIRSLSIETPPGAIGQRQDGTFIYQEKLAGQISVEQPRRSLGMIPSAYAAEYTTDILPDGTVINAGQKRTEFKPLDLSQPFLESQKKSQQEFVESRKLQEGQDAYGTILRDVYTGAEILRSDSTGASTARGSGSLDIKAKEAREKLGIEEPRQRYSLTPDSVNRVTQSVTPEFLKLRSIEELKTARELGKEQRENIKKSESEITKLTPILNEREQKINTLSKDIEKLSFTPQNEQQAVSQLETRNKKIEEFNILVEQQNKDIDKFESATSGLESQYERRQKELAESGNTFGQIKLTAGVTGQKFTEGYVAGLGAASVISGGVNLFRGSQIASSVSSISGSASTLPQWLKTGAKVGAYTAGGVLVGYPVYAEGKRGYQEFKQEGLNPIIGTATYAFPEAGLQAGFIAPVGSSFKKTEQITDDILGPSVKADRPRLTDSDYLPKDIIKVDKSLQNNNLFKDNPDIILARQPGELYSKLPDYRQGEVDVVSKVNIDDFKRQISDRNIKLTPEAQKSLDSVSKGKTVRIEYEPDGTINVYEESSSSIATQTEKSTLDNFKKQRAPQTLDLNKQNLDITETKIEDLGIPKKSERANILDSTTRKNKIDTSGIPISEEDIKVTVGGSTEGSGLFRITPEGTVTALPERITSSFKGFTKTTSDGSEFFIMRSIERKPDLFAAFSPSTQKSAADIADVSSFSYSPLSDSSFLYKPTGKTAPSIFLSTREIGSNYRVVDDLYSNEKILRNINKDSRPSIGQVIKGKTKKEGDIATITYTTATRELSESQPRLGKKFVDIVTGKPGFITQGELRGQIGLIEQKFDDLSYLPTETKIPKEIRNPKNVPKSDAVLQNFFKSNEEIQSDIDLSGTFGFKLPTTETRSIFEGGGLSATRKPETLLKITEADEYTGTFSKPETKKQKVEISKNIKKQIERKDASVEIGSGSSITLSTRDIDLIRLKREQKALVDSIVESQVTATPKNPIITGKLPKSRQIENIRRRETTISKIIEEPKFKKEASKLIVPSGLKGASLSLSNTLIQQPGLRTSPVSKQIPEQGLFQRQQQKQTQQQQQIQEQQKAQPPLVPVVPFVPFNFNQTPPREAPTRLPTPIGTGITLSGGSKRRRGSSGQRDLSTQYQADYQAKVLDERDPFAGRAPIYTGTERRYLKENPQSRAKRATRRPSGLMNLRL